MNSQPKCVWKQLTQTFGYLKQLLLKEQFVVLIGCWCAVSCTVCHNVEQNFFSPKHSWVLWPQWFQAASRSAVTSMWTFAFSFAFFNASAYEQETVEKVVKTLLQVTNFWHLQFLEGSQKKKNNDFFNCCSQVLISLFVFPCRPSAWGQLSYSLMR